MGYNTYTTLDLINDILLLGHVPTGNNTFTSSELLTLSTFEMLTPIAKQILSTRGGYYMTYEDQTLAADGLYSIPVDCVAGALINVELVQGPTIIPVSPIEESEQFSTNAPTSTSYGFFMRGNRIQILPIPNVGTPRFWFAKRMSTLVLTSACGQITAVNTTTVTVSSLPSTMVVDAVVDLCGDQPPFNILGDGLTITAVSGTDITLDQDASLLGVSVGDWICLHKQTCVPPIPVEFRLLLAQRVVCKIYELQGYKDKLALAEKKLEMYEQDTFGLITPRVSSKTKVISPVDGGFLKGNPNRNINFPAGRE